MVTIASEAKQSQWNEIVLKNAPRSGAFLQSYEWGEFQKRVGREVRRYESPNACVQIVQYPIRKNLYGWTAYRAPIGMRDQGLGIREQIIADLKNTRGIFLHIEPAREAPITQLLNYSISRSHQPQKTTLLDLTKSEDDLLASMHEKTRYNIRLAHRHGVVVNRLNGTDPPSFVIFWEMMQTTAARQKFHLHERSYYSAMLADLRGEIDEHGRATAHLYLATKDGHPLASLIAISFGDTVTYLHGANSNDAKNLMAPYALHWGVIRNAKTHGARAYDFWGIDAARWPGVTRFKLGFGGEEVSYPPAVELPLRPFWYKMYDILRNVKT